MVSELGSYSGVVQVENSGACFGSVAHGQVVRERHKGGIEVACIIQILKPTETPADIMVFEAFEGREFGLEDLRCTRNRQVFAPKPVMLREYET